MNMLYHQVYNGNGIQGNPTNRPRSFDFRHRLRSLIYAQHQSMDFTSLKICGFWAQNLKFAQVVQPQQQVHTENTTLLVLVD